MYIYICAVTDIEDLNLLCIVGNDLYMLHYFYLCICCITYIYTYITLGIVVYL